MSKRFEADWSNGNHPIYDSEVCISLDIGQVATALNAYRDDIERLRVQRDEFQVSFDLRWKADRRAARMWQEETGEELVWPDHADLCVWLMNKLRLTRAEADASGRVMLELQQECVKLRMDSHG